MKPEVPEYKPQIRIDLSQVLAGDKPVTIELGCGKTKIEGRIGVDRLDMPTVDIVADIEKGLPFLPDNSVDEIHTRSFLEHVENLERVMSEIVRILRVGGKCYIFVPHFSNPYFYSDYTHKHFMGLYTFYYFVDERHQLNRKVPYYYSNVRIRVLSQRLVFESPFKSTNRIKRFLSGIFNRSTRLQEFYEENLCYIFPCYALELVITPDK